MSWVGIVYGNGLSPVRANWQSLSELGPTCRNFSQQLSIRNTFENLVCWLSSFLQASFLWMISKFINRRYTIPHLHTTIFDVNACVCLVYIYQAPKCFINLTVSGAFSAQRPVTRSFDVLFDMRLDKELSKQSRGWWFEMISRPLWRHCNVKIYVALYNLTSCHEEIIIQMFNIVI